MLFINLAGFALIALIVWWFWLYQPSETVLDESLDISVDNGVYQPARLRIPAGESVTLQFLRKDESPCAETVIFPQLDISATLPLGKPVSVELPPLAAGEYPFHCQMQMYRGVLLVV